MKKTKRGSKQLIADSGRDGDNRLDCNERVRDLENENRSLQKENEELRFKLENISSTPSSGAQKLKDDYLQKLIVLEDQVSQLKNKRVSKSHFSVQRPKGDEGTKRIQFDMQSLKAQKVQLQCKMKVDSLHFRLCKAAMEKEVLQMKRENRRNQYEMHKLLDSNHILKMVLQRKTLEASMANKRLKELLESRKALSNKRTGSRNGNNSRIQALENEHEITTQLHALCSEYERQMDVLVEENAKLKEEIELLKQENSSYSLQEDVDSMDKDLDVKELKEQIVSLGGLLRQLRVQKEESDNDNKSQGVSSNLSISFGSSDQSVEKETSSSVSQHSKTSNIARDKVGSNICCSCSKKSLCKTTKCKCRHIGGTCGASCGCAASKCTNREAVSIQLSDSPQSGVAEAVKSAQLEEPIEKIDPNGISKKPLSDIGNVRLRRNA